MDEFLGAVPDHLKSGQTEPKSGGPTKDAGKQGEGNTQDPPKK